MAQRDREDPHRPSRRRGQGELESQVLGALREAEAPVTAAWVQERLGGDLAYTTVVTILTRLLAKDAVARERRGRSFVAAHRRRRGPGRAQDASASRRRATARPSSPASSPRCRRTTNRSCARSWRRPTRRAGPRRRTGPMRWEGRCREWGRRGARRYGRLTSHGGLRLSAARPATQCLAGGTPRRTASASAYGHPAADGGRHRHGPVQHTLPGPAHGRRDRAAARQPLPDGWSDAEVRAAVPHDEIAGKAAIPALVLVLAVCARTLWRHRRVAQRARRALAALPSRSVVVLPEEKPYAYALPADAATAWWSPRPCCAASPHASAVPCSRTSGPT